MMMQINDLYNQVSGWLNGFASPGYPIILSSRVRLARNLSDVKFSSCNTSEEREEVIQRVRLELTDSRFFKQEFFLRLKDITELERRFLAERHLISREQELNYQNGAVSIGEAERYAVMINEEDHLRLQAIKGGLDLKAAYETINAVDNELGKKLPFGFSVRYGYLTACPTNTGSGLRASVMVHLPALVQTKQIRKVLPAISRLGLAIRGVFGEGTDVMGNLFQVSNQLTLGKSETEAVQNVEQVAKKLIGYEEETRRHLKDDKNSNLADNVWRAYGILKYARSLNLSEAMELLSMLRLGVDLGIIAACDYSCLNKLLLFINSAHLLLRSGVREKLPVGKINTLRADFIRGELE